MAREKLTTALETDGDPWLLLGPTSYQADGEVALLIAAREVGEDGGLRVVERVRPWQPGAKLDETGPMPDVFTLGVYFNADISEPELDTQGIPIWPDLLEALVRQFKTGRTATLHLPWKRGLRVKPLTWQRRAAADDNRGGETLSVTFKQDNEDALDREAFEAVAVKANVKRAAEEAVFALEQDGMSAAAADSLRSVSNFGGLGDPGANIVELAASLADLINQPNEFAQAIAVQAQRLRRAGKLLMTAYSSGDEGRDQMNGPEGASARAKLLALLELAANAEAEALASLPRTRGYTAQRRTTIWLIATELRQNARELMSINSDVEDFSYIEQGTSVKVFAE
jgi:hypothetical protein